LKTTATVPGFLVVVAGHVLHPDSCEVEPSKVQQFTGTLKVKDHLGQPPRVRELCQKWAAAPNEPVPELWIEVWVTQPIEVKGFDGRRQMVPVFVRMHIVDFVWVPMKSAPSESPTISAPA
jgi:hypothetical protein